MKVCATAHSQHVLASYSRNWPSSWPWPFQIFEIVMGHSLILRCCIWRIYQYPIVSIESLITFGPRNTLIPSQIFSPYLRLRSLGQMFLCLAKCLSWRLVWGASLRMRYSRCWLCPAWLLMQLGWFLLSSRLRFCGRLYFEIWYFYRWWVQMAACLKAVITIMQEHLMKLLYYMIWMAMYLKSD